MPVITPSIGQVVPSERAVHPAPGAAGGSAPSTWSGRAPAAGGSSSNFVRVFGDLKRAGHFRLEEQTSGVAVFGDVYLDLREAELPARAELTVYSLFGDVKVVVPPGLTVQVSGFSLFGDDKLEGTAPDPAGPTLRIHRVGAFSDVKVKTALPGEKIPKRWKFF